MALIIGEGGRDDHEAIALETRKKNWIRNRREPEKAPESLAAGIGHAVDAFPDAIPISATAVYNCAGLVFGSRRTWVAMKDVPMVLRDDGFRLETEPENWKPGDVVLYRQEPDADDVSHVGFIYSVAGDLELADYEVTVISQWGETGEFLHELEELPIMLGQFSEVWTQHREW